MSRTKGSKIVPSTLLILYPRLQSIVSLTLEITTITANINALKADLKEKKTALKTAQKELTKLGS